MEVQGDQGGKEDNRRHKQFSADSIGAWSKVCTAIKFERQIKDNINII